MGGSEPGLIGSFLHLPQDLLQALGHVVRPLHASVVSLQILQEAKEESVHSHGVDTEESACNEVTADRDYHDRSEVVVEGRNLVLESKNSNDLLKTLTPLLTLISGISPAKAQ